jgi:hypothetical protein
MLVLPSIGTINLIRRRRYSIDSSQSDLIFAYAAVTQTVYRQRLELRNAAISDLPIRAFTAIHPTNSPNPTVS